jgi:hypothetical protein
MNILPAMVIIIMVVWRKPSALKLILSCRANYNSESLSELLTLEMLELVSEQYSNYDI